MHSGNSGFKKEDFFRELTRIDFLFRSAVYVWSGTEKLVAENQQTKTNGNANDT